MGSLAGSFRCPFLLLFLGALYVAWVFFYVGLFSVRTFFFSCICYPETESHEPPSEGYTQTVKPSDQPHQEAACCSISIGLLLFLNRKAEKLGINSALWVVGGRWSISDAPWTRP
jgi:hypothetical protein